MVTVVDEAGSTGSDVMDAAPSPSRLARVPGLVRVMGPGLVVMLADTDAGCLITAAQSGTEWGYAMVLPQLVLIPILYLAQEITVRLGLVTGKGHGQLIRDHFGLRWGLLSAGTLLLSAVGALLTEFAGVAGVGQLFGISKWVTVPVCTGALIGLAFTRSDRRIERIAIALGLGELFFIPAMLLAHPKLHEVIHGLGSIPANHPSYTYLVAANVGAVVMPWMIFYQQSAVVNRGLTMRHLRRERQDTAIGTLLTQAIMIVVVVTFASTVWQHHRGATLNTVTDMTTALGPFLGSRTADVLLGAAVLGGALVAAIVVSLAGSWGISEVLGWKHSLNERPNRTNAKFYLVYSAAHILGAILVLASVNLIRLVIDVEVLNALLLPIVLGFLLLLERKALPDTHRMHGAYRAIVTGLCLIVIGFGLYMIPATLGV